MNVTNWTNLFFKTKLIGGAVVLGIVVIVGLVWLLIATKVEKK